MSVHTVTKVPVNSRVEALRAKHRELSNQVEEARKRLSTTDFYLNQLKKKKLLVKERLVSEESRATG